MSLLHSLCTASALVAALGACASAPPGPLAQGHPARADVTVSLPEPTASALRDYRDFRIEAPESAQPMPDHSMHQHHQLADPPIPAPEEEGHEHHH